LKNWGVNLQFVGNSLGSILKFWKNWGPKWKIITMRNLKFLALCVIWKSLHLTWTKYFINFHYFENSSNYYLNNEIQLKIFKFPQNITLPQNISQRTFDFFIWPNRVDELVEKLSVKLVKFDEEQSKRKCFDDNHLLVSIQKRLKIAIWAKIHITGASFAVTI